MKPPKPLTDSERNALMVVEENLGADALERLLGLIGRRGVLTQWRKLKAERESAVDDLTDGDEQV